MAKSKAQNAIERARTVLIIEQPFFGCLAMQLALEERASKEWWGDNTPTMAVDGCSMFYYPDFVLSLSDKELQGVVGHEVMHCAYQHITRRGVRNPIVWNWAGDYVINADLLKANFTLPKGRLHDPKYDGMSTEEVYERIRQEIQQHQSKGKGQKGNGDRDKGGCGAVLDAGSGDGKHKPDGTGPAMADAIGRDWETNVRMAVAVARAHNAGNVPGYLERLVGHLKDPKVSWRDLTRQFIDGNMHKDYSWSRPNRRFASSNLIFPGFVPDALHHLVCFMDVSGSISDELMQAMGSEVGGALDAGIADKLTLVYIDTEIKKVDEYVTGDLVEIGCSGGGGTDFRPAFEWLNKNVPDASCCIFLTDMMPNTWELPETTVPVLWGAYCPESMLQQMQVPFGSVVHIDGPDW